jgi:hypothetical protein
MQYLWHAPQQLVCCYQHITLFLSNSATSAVSCLCSLRLAVVWAWHCSTFLLVRAFDGFPFAMLW